MCVTHEHILLFSRTLKTRFLYFTLHEEKFLAKEKYADNINFIAGAGQNIHCRGFWHKHKIFILSVTIQKSLQI